MAFTNWIEYVQDITRRMTEMKNIEKPEASDMEAYLAYAIKEKRLNQEWEALLTAVRSSGKFNNSMLDRAINKAIPENEREAVLNRIDNFYRGDRVKKIREIAQAQNKYPTIKAAGLMTPDELARHKQALLKGEYFDSDVFGRLTPEEQDRVSAFYMKESDIYNLRIVAVTSAYKSNPEIMGRIMEGLGEEVQASELQELTTQLSSKKSVMELPPEDQVTYPWLQKAVELKLQAAEQFENDSEKLREINAALDYAATKLTRVKPEAKDETMYKVQCIDEATKAYERKILEQQQNAGKNIFIAQKQNLPNNNTKIAGIDDNTMGELLNDPQNLMSPGYKDTLLRMLRKMDEMGMLKPGEAASAEEKTKKYAYKFIIDARKDLQSAMDEGDFDRIISAKNKYEEVSRNYDELVAMTEGLGQSTFSMQANIDCTRNDDMPWEYNRDIRKHVQINGVYQMYIQMHALNLTPEQYLNNIPANGIKYYKDQSYFMGIGSEEKDKDFNGIMDILLNPEVPEGIEGFITNENTFRGFNAVQIMEPDPDRKESMVVFENRMALLCDNVMRNEVLRAGIFHVPYSEDNENAEAVKGLREEALENLITVSDEKRDLRKILPPPTIGDDGKLEKPFSIDEYVRDNEPDYDGMRNRINILMEKAAVIQAEEYTYTYTDKHNNTSVEILASEVLRPEQVIYAAFRAARRVMEARQADAGTEKYEALHRDVRNLITMLPPESSLQGEENEERLHEVQRIKREMSEAFPVRSVSEYMAPIVSFRKNAYEGREPEISDRQNYLAYRSKKNEADWLYSAVKTAVCRSGDIGVEELDAAISEAVPADRLAAVREKAEKRLADNRANNIYIKAQENGKAYKGLPGYSDMDADAKTGFRQRMMDGEVFDINAWKDLSEDEKTRSENAFLGKADRFRNRLAAYESAIGDDMDVISTLYGKLQEKLSPYESWLLSKRLEEIPAPGEREAVTETENLLENEISEFLKYADKNIPDSDPINVQKKEAIRNALNPTDMMLYMGAGKDEFIKMALEKERDIAYVNQAEEKAFLNEKKQQNDDKVLYFGEGTPVFNAMPVLVREEKAASFHEEKPRISDNYKTTLVSMLQKMKDMNLMPQGTAALSEEDTKYLAFKNLMKAKKEFEAAIRNKDLDGIIAKKNDYVQEYRNVQELMNMAENGLDKDIFSMPGDVNLTGNKELPWNLIRDVKLQAQVNGVFQMYAMMQTLGIERPEDFVDNIAANGVRYVHQRLDSAGVNGMAKNRDFEGIAALLTDKENTKNLDVVTGDAAENRWLEALQLMEPEKADPMGMSPYRENFNKMTFDMAAREKLRLNLLSVAPDPASPNYELEKRLRKEALENLITVADSDRNDLSAILGLPGTDENGQQKPAFDIEAYVRDKGNDYAGMTDRVNTLLAQCAGKTGAPSETEILDAARAAYRRVLDARAADRGNPQYDALEREYLSLPEKIFTGKEEPSLSSGVSTIEMNDFIGYVQTTVGWLCPLGKDQIPLMLLSPQEAEDIPGTLDKLLHPSEGKVLPPKEEKRKLGMLISALSNEISEKSADISSEDKLRINGAGYIKKGADTEIKELTTMMKAAVKRGKELLANENSVVGLSMFSTLETMINRVERGVSLDQVVVNEPVAVLPAANYNAPSEVSDRAENPIVPGQTTAFTAEELEEKGEVYPFHKIVRLSGELDELWIDYIKKSAEGTFSSEDEERFKAALKQKYTDITAVYNDINEKARSDEFINQNQRILTGQGNYRDVYSDSMGDARGLGVTMRVITAKNEALDRGWPAGEIAAYGQIWQAIYTIDRHMDEIRDQEFAEFRQRVEAFNNYLKENFADKPYESDNALRGEKIRKAEILLSDLERVRDEQIARLKAVDPQSEDITGKWKMLQSFGNIYNITPRSNIKTKMKTVLASMSERARTAELRGYLSRLDANDRNYPQGAGEYHDFKAALREVVNIREESAGFDHDYPDKVRSAVKRLQSKAAAMETGLAKEWYANQKISNLRAAAVGDLRSIIGSAQMNPDDKLAGLSAINKKLNNRTDSLLYTSPEYRALKKEIKRAAEFYEKNINILKAGTIPPAPPVDPSSPEGVRLFAEMVQREAERIGAEPPAMSENAAPEENFSKLSAWINEKKKAALKIVSERDQRIRNIEELLGKYNEEAVNRENEQLRSHEEERVRGLGEIYHAVLPGREEKLNALWNDRASLPAMNSLDPSEALRTAFSPRETADRNNRLIDTFKVLDDIHDYELAAFCNAGTEEGHLDSPEFDGFVMAFRDFKTGNRIKDLPADCEKLIEAAEKYAKNPESGILGEKRLKLCERVIEAATAAKTSLNHDIRMGYYDENELNAVFCMDHFEAFSISADDVADNITCLRNEAGSAPIEPEQAEPEAVAGILNDNVAAKLIEKYDSLATEKEKITFYADCIMLVEGGNLLPNGGEETLELLERHMFMEGNELRPHAVDNFMAVIRDVNADWKIEAARKQIESGSKDANISLAMARANALSNRLGTFMTVKELPYNLTKGAMEQDPATGTWKQIMTDDPDRGRVPASWDMHYRKFFGDEIKKRAPEIDFDKIDIITLQGISNSREQEILMKNKLEVMKSMPEGTTMDPGFAASLKKTASDLRNLTGDLGGIQSNKGVGHIADSMDSLAEIVNKSYQMSRDSGGSVKAMADVSRQISNYIEYKSMDPQWGTEKRVIKESLLATLKALSPGMYENWQKREEKVKETAGRVRDNKEALSSYFKEQSSKGRDTLEKIVKARIGGDDKGSRERIRDIINKRYGLGQELSDELAGEAMRYLNKGAEIGVDVAKYYDTSYQFMDHLTRTADSLRFADYEVERKDGKVNVQFVPKVRGEKLKTVGTVLDQNGLWETKEDNLVFLKGVLQEPERIDRLREMLETGKRMKLFNWNSTEYNKLKESLKDFCEKRDEVLRLINNDEYMRDELPEDKKNELNAKIRGLTDSLATAVTDTRVYSDKVLGGGSIMDKTQNAGVVRAAAAFGLREAFAELAPEVADAIAPAAQRPQLSSEEKIRVKKFTQLYNEEYAKEKKAANSNRHRNAAEHAIEKERRQVNEVRR